jgi:hypothetical protein
MRSVWPPDVKGTGVLYESTSNTIILVFRLLAESRGNDEQFYDWYTLAMRLQGSWPEFLQFCHHCLVFLPTLCLGPQLFATDKLICLDCIRFRVEIPRCPAHLTNCTGCLLVQERLGEEELHESPHDSDSGAHMRKSALRRGR